MRHTISRLLFSIWISLPATTVYAQQFQAGDTLFIQASVASMRSLPAENASIAAKLPIGTSMIYVRSASESEPPENRQCSGRVPESDTKWSCVCLNNINVDFDEQWCAWVDRDLLSSTKPELNALKNQFEKTPSDQLQERRKWAERAIALAPLDKEAQARLLRVLEQLEDTKVLEAAKRGFDSYANPQVKSSNTKLIYIYNAQYLMPLAQIKNGQIEFRNVGQTSNAEFRQRGAVFHLYTEGSRLGSVITEAQFDCRARSCPPGNFARAIGSAGTSEPQFGIATNYKISEKETEYREINKEERAIIKKFGEALLKTSSLSNKNKKKFLAEVAQANPTSQISIASLDRDGRTMLIANWSVGSMNDAHYGDENSFYESILIIAEKQKDGSFRLGQGSGSIAESGCSYHDHLDLDGDGIDEIFLSCEQLEGQGNYSILKRINNSWKIFNGPFTQ